MPSWPSGVLTGTVIFGAGFSPFGNPTSSKLVVTPIFTGTKTVVWAATSTPMLPFAETATAVEGVSGTAQLPFVDQDGWLDDGQHPYTLWGYRLDEVNTYGTSKGPTRTKYLQLLTGQSTVYFDDIPDGSLGLPAAGPVATVTSVNGQVGAVTIDTGASLTDVTAAAEDPATDLGALLAERPTAASVAATYVAFKQAAKEPDLLIVGAVTRNADGTVASAAVVWPDGTAGTYTPLAFDPSLAVNSYQITYGSPATKTYTQPTITRDSTGAASNIPQIVVS